MRRASCSPAPSGVVLALTVADVAGTFDAIAAAGKGEDRIGLMADLFARAARTRLASSAASRRGRRASVCARGLLEEAVATAFGRELEAVRRAHMLTGEIGEAARLARDDRLAEAALHVMRPIRFMLATPVADAAEVMRRVGDEAWIEDKYDGIRAQLHVDAGGDVRLFSRDLNDVTRSFPEIVEATAALPDLGPLVIDGELVPWRQGSVLDFASLQTRLGRVRPSAELQAEVPGRARGVRPAPSRRRGPDRDPAARAPSQARGAGPARTGAASGSCSRTSRAHDRWTRSSGTSTTRASAATRGS